MQKEGRVSQSVSQSVSHGKFYNAKEDRVQSGGKKLLAASAVVVVVVLEMRY